MSVFFKDFIYLFDRKKSQVVGEAGRERERRKQAPHQAESPVWNWIPGP